ncbi:MAG: HAD-IIB family hydrolase [Erysipelotrichaceae bacterium]
MDYSKYIIYTDVDGTAIHSYKSLSYLNKKAIREFIENGGMFGVASGRTRRSIDEIFPLINMPYVEANGTVISDNDGTIIFKSLLNRNFKQNLFDYVKERKTLMLTALGKETTKVLMNDERDDKILDFRRKLISYEEYMNTDVLKASIIAPEEEINKAIEELKSLNFMNSITGSRSSKMYYEMYNTDADKGLGIKKAIEYRKLNNRTVVCIGDFENDLNMLKMADIALCPDNAIDEVKEICVKVLPDSKHNTIYHALKYLKTLV